MSFAEDLITTEDQQQQLLGVKIKGLRDFSGVERQAIFDDLRSYLAAHVAAEQVWADPTASPRPVEVATDSSDPASPNLPMRAAAERIAEAVTAMESVAIDSTEFTTGIDRLAILIDAHAEIAGRQIDRLVRIGGEDCAEDMLFAINQVPMLSSGEAHEKEQSVHFGYRDRFEADRTSFQVMPRPHDS